MRYVEPNGAWVSPVYRGFKYQCCDCGLTHRFWFRIKDGVIQFRTERDNRATAAAKRRLVESSSIGG